MAIKKYGSFTYDGTESIEGIGSTKYGDRQTAGFGNDTLISVGI